MAILDQKRFRERDNREDSAAVSNADYPDQDPDQDAIMRKTQAAIMSGSTESVYNPHQDKDTIRGARKVLRSYEEKASTMKDNATTITAEEFDSQVIGLDSNFKSHVRAPAEATIDSRALRILSETALKKSKSLKTDINAFDPDEFVMRFRQVMTANASMDTVGNLSEDEEDTSQEIDWVKVGRRLMRFSRRAPTIDLMYGPLEIQHKKRKFTQRSKLEKRDADRKEPELIENNDIERSQAEMSKLILTISKILEKQGGEEGMNLFEFFINPESFAQSVENLFCLSFLIRDGKAAIDTATPDGGQELEFPLVYSTEPAAADVHQEGFVKTLIILELTMKDWEDAIQLFGIRESVIPHREAQVTTTSNKGKWH